MSQSTEDFVSRIAELETENAELRSRIVSLESELSKSSEYAEKIRGEASDLSRRLGEYKKREILAETVGTQTEEYVESKASEKKEDDAWQGNGSSLADEVREAAEAVTRNQGMVFEERSGLYYDYKSGYYYDAKIGMWYDGSSGKYFHYDPDLGEHKEMGNVKPEERKKTETKRERRRRKREKIRKKRLKRDKTQKQQPEDGECDSSTSTSSPSDTSEEEPPHPDKIPCVRLVVSESEDSKVGSLFMVTHPGGSIGREGPEHDVLLPDPGCSKFHAKISYEEKRGKYFLRDLGSRNGTWLNGKRMSASKSESELFEILHRSKIKIGKTLLLAHIHPHLETCGGCEPGLLLKSEESEEKVGASLEQGRKRKLNDMKKKYGLRMSDMSSGAEGNYNDRAEERRLKVGSDNPYEKTEAASLQTSIDSRNKGFNMLAKMGWKEGEGLGKTSSGVAEPVPIEQRNERAGLGSGASALPKVDPKAQNKSEIWKKTQERFNKLS